eukprot:CAMPEP_0204631004 /NCGR_PEP_ID=MMETSP0717-20131115/21805_1 /ASSEMBLY_ACC=CAM_ASM_000666 /TAXON_ID=230516 /ORGANISM="Chaetoceros curvisetus" /LENGTH=50 /DNA_ID=CAMNT_0051648457 /DNA_START=182 /DNA_END=331 /DNA_ORIENTATION=-
MDTVLPGCGIDPDPNFASAYCIPDLLSEKFSDGADDAALETLGVRVMAAA